MPGFRLALTPPNRRNQFGVGANRNLKFGVANSNDIRSMPIRITQTGEIGVLLSQKLCPLSQVMIHVVGQDFDAIQLGLFREINALEGLPPTVGMRCDTRTTLSVDFPTQVHPPHAFLQLERVLDSVDQQVAIAPGDFDS